MSFSKQKRFKAKAFRLKEYVQGRAQGFLEGAADFQKVFENFDDLFFRSAKLIFRALLKHYKDAVFAKLSVLADFGLFLETFPLKISIYWRRKRL